MLHIVALGVVYRTKSCNQTDPSRQVLICPFRHFCCSMYRLATEHTEKPVEEKTRPNVNFFGDRQPGVHNALVALLLLFTDFVNY